MAHVCGMSTQNRQALRCGGWGRRSWLPHPDHAAIYQALRTETYIRCAAARLCATAPKPTTANDSSAEHAEWHCLVRHLLKSPPTVEHGRSVSAAFGAHADTGRNPQ